VAKFFVFVFRAELALTLTELALSASYPPQSVRTLKITFFC
jgi:hypothetical protein